MEIGIFFDVQHLISYTPLLLQRSRYDSSSRNNLLFLIITDDTMRKLDSLSPGQGRIDFVNSLPFVNSIIYFLYTCYDLNDKSISLGKCDPRYVIVFLNTVALYFEASFHVTSEYKEYLIDNGFTDPKFCDKDKICLYKQNVFSPSVDRVAVKLDLDYVHSQQSHKYCNIQLQLTPETLHYLRYITMAGVTHESDGRFQREIFGVLRIANNKQTSEGIVYTLEIDKNSTMHGETESVSSITPYLYTFHSHPYQAYLRHESKLGFPSCSDYIAMYILFAIGMIVHFVSSIEGLYVIHVNPSSSLLTQKSQKIIDYIKKTLNIDKKSVSNIHEYVEMVNKGGLFFLEFIPWEQTSHVIKIQFTKTKGNCIIR